VPIGAGLSSSAAIEVGFALSFQALQGWSIDRMHLARICQEAESQYVGVHCGLMDQFACAHGVAGHALYFDTRNLEWMPIPLPHGVSIIIADSGVQRTLANSAYNERRKECEQAVALFSTHLPNIHSLRDVEWDDFVRLRSHLPQVVAMRVEHVIAEIARVQQACQLLMQDDVRALGDLMLAGHNSLRDLYQVSCPELDDLVEIAIVLQGCYGARLTGAGFGGCIVTLVQNENVDAFTEQLAEQYLQRTGKSAKVYVCQAARGAYTTQV